MADEKRLIPNELVTVDSFRRDLSEFLGLSLEQLDQLSSIGDSAVGYSATQSMEFAKAASLSVEIARRTLRVTRYLYERCRDSSIDPVDAAAELVRMASDLDLTEDIETKESALQRLMSLNDHYEAGSYAESRATSVVAHFGGIDAVWDIRPIFHRHTNRIIRRIPVLIMGVSWHDNTAQHHEASFQLTAEEWSEFKSKIAEIDVQWESISEELRN